MKKDAFACQKLHLRGLNPFLTSQHFSPVSLQYPLFFFNLWLFNFLLCYFYISSTFLALPLLPFLSSLRYSSSIIYLFVYLLLHFSLLSPLPLVSSSLSLFIYNFFLTLFVFLTYHYHCCSFISLSDNRHSLSHSSPLPLFTFFVYSLSSPWAYNISLLLPHFSHLPSLPVFISISFTLLIYLLSQCSFIRPVFTLSVPPPPTLLYHCYPSVFITLSLALSIYLPLPQIFLSINLGLLPASHTRPFPVMSSQILCRFRPTGQR